MKAITFVKIALLLVVLTALIYWQDVWAWVSAKTWSELAGDILGFALKWFYLAIFGWLAVTIPHYLNPWLKLARVNGRRKLRAARRDGGRSSHQVEARTTMPRMNKNQALVWMMSQMAKDNPSPRPPKTNGAFGEGTKDEIHLRF